MFDQGPTLHLPRRAKNGLRLTPTYILPRFCGLRASRINRSTCSSIVTSFGPNDSGSEVTWRPMSLFEIGSSASSARAFVWSGASELSRCSRRRRVLPLARGTELRGAKSQNLLCDCCEPTQPADRAGKSRERSGDCLCLPAECEA